MTSKAISIYANQFDLSGVLHLPERVHHRKVPLIVLLHGFVGSKVGEHRLFVKAARYFTEKGYAVFRFDFSGCGESSGDYADVTVTKQLNEVQAVLNYVSMLPEVDANNIILIGHSLGGAVASLTAAKDRRIHKLILWSPVGRPYEDITGILGESAMKTVATNGVVDYHGFYVSQAFLTDLKNHHPLEAICSYQGAALIVHAQEDEAVPKEHAARYSESLQQRSIPERVSTHYIEGADHTFSSYTFENVLFTESAEWLESCNEYPEEIA
ncbi:Alpha/beta fold hydrolase [Sporosarcina sp. ANT_H38]|uniref:alpha/beta hydrolase family protein n=1 Tax=Sporosarcina sp. ANT_H38 TaxID=2597358 RepID=UPI00165D33E0|nr:alpha/beta fold hydrolase [Sporosarcina sp. ANT_H38]